jgi:plastocyanin
MGRAKGDWGQVMGRIRGLVIATSVAAMSIALPAVAGAHTKTVYAGPPPSTKTIAGKLGIGKGFGNKYNPGINDFFLHRVTVNVGDTVAFIPNGFHTIDLPGKSGRDLPLLVPGPTVTGADDFAGNPFWFNGKVPSLGFNHELIARSGPPAYDGSTRIDSGLPTGSGPPKPLKVTFTKPGVYKYFCDVHPGMIGYVVVKAKGKPVPSATQDAAAVTNQVTADVLSAKRLAGAKVPANHVSLGESSSSGVELYAMFPATLSVQTGAVVTFSMSQDSREAHTASFGPRKYLMTLANSFNGPAPLQQALYPSDPGAISFSPTSHGNGFANTGALDRDPATPLPSSYQIKFTKVGVYHFVCLIHPFMQGTIVVKRSVAHGGG